MTEYTFYMDGYLKSNFDIVLNEAIPNDWDALFIVTGKEGAGKTTLSSQGCYYFDHNFNIDYVAFLPEQFERIVEDCPPESSILWDEAITGVNAAGWASKVSQSVISKLTQIRKKRLKLFLCFPYLHMINKYLISRCVATIYVYSKGFKDRGHALFYNQEQTEDLYALMKEKYRLTPRKAYYHVSNSFYFRFHSKLCLPKAEYEDAKDEARKNNDYCEDKGQQMVRNLAIYHCPNCKKPMPKKDIAEMYGCTVRNIDYIIRKKETTNLTLGDD